MSVVDNPAPKEWTFPYRLRPYFFNKRIAKKLLNKHVYVGLAYIDKEGNVNKKELFHGIVMAADTKSGVQIWENGTGKMKTLPPDLRAWKRAKKDPYKDRVTREAITDVDYVATWLVLEKHLLSPKIGNEKLVRTTSGTYYVYGFGTRMVGKANKSKDGSFTTTKWLTLLFFPIWPLGTFRISNRSQTVTFGFGLNGKHASDPLFMDTRQVVHTYLIWLPLLVLFILAITK